MDQMLVLRRVYAFGKEKSGKREDNTVNILFNSNSGFSDRQVSQCELVTLSGDQLSDSLSGIDKWDGASVIQSSHETKRKSPPRLRA